MYDRTTETLRVGAATIIVHRPVLCDAERAKREQRTRDTLGAVMRDYYKRKESTPCRK